MAASILLTAVALTFAGYLHMLRDMYASDVQQQLDVDVQQAVERIKYDVRLSSLDKMFFYPDGPGPYTAMSFPMARDDDDDGVVDKDADDHIIWDRSIVYHVWTNQPHQLRRTIFDPRDTQLTDSQRQQQLATTAVNGSGAAAANGANAETQIVFENLFTWQLLPHGAVFDAYAPERTLADNVNLGSCVLAAGTHQIGFSVIGKNTDSSGYAIGIDTLTASPSHSVREAEDLLPADSQTGVFAESEYMPGGSWSGNQQLRFPATTVGHDFTLSVDNDLWKETNFDCPGDTRERTEVRFLETGGDYDFALGRLGNDTNWTARGQTGTNSVSAWPAAGAAVRVLLRGEEMIGGNWIAFDGGESRVCLTPGNSDPVCLTAVYIGRCASQVSNSMNAVSGTQQPVLFGGQPDIKIESGARTWSDPIDIEIHRTNTYAVSCLIGENPASGALAWWPDTASPGLAGSYLIPSSAAPDAAMTAAAAWGGYSNVVAYAGVLGVEAMHTGYPASGTYESAIFDTQCDSPAYSEIKWNADVPAGTFVELRVRTGNAADMSDTADWADQTPIPNFGVIGIGSGRYLQFHVTLAADTDRVLSPIVRDVTIRWDGPQRVVDIGGAFTKTPSSGIVEVTVDGEQIVTGVTLDMEIYRDIRAHQGTRRLRSQISAEINPRNSGL